MSDRKKIKKDLWSNIFRLIIPHKRKFLWVVTLGLLSTGASLIEPLIYREAINDVAGLFVKQAGENARKDLGLDPGDLEQINNSIEDEVPSSDTPASETPSLQPPATTKPVSGTAHDNSGAPPKKQGTAHGAKKGHKQPAPVVKPPEPHAQSH